MPTASTTSPPSSNRRISTPVTLDKALRDPAYKTPDPYAAKDGVDWMERWSMQLNKQLPWDDYAEPPADIQKEYERLDKD